VSRRFDNGRDFQRRVAKQVVESFSAAPAKVGNDPSQLPTTNVQMAFVQAAVKVR